MLIATGLPICVASLHGLRMMMAGWRRRILIAERTRVTHVVWRRSDSLGTAMWVVFYVLGGLSILAGLFAIG